eukprot:TRINITY_DN8522_c0_g2_i1.p1 TRINITY_DN8522_c0_g2~~TRINITY_DN8522_c0_g2_i1.p1  ORF type:complete len:139 (+),score=11.10 TRINITY_DN8522_c0_g2_i1:49-417(+)
MSKNIENLNKGFDAVALEERLEMVQLAAFADTAGSLLCDFGSAEVEVSDGENKEQFPVLQVGRTGVLPLGVQIPGSPTFAVDAKVENEFNCEVIQLDLKPQRKFIHFITFQIKLSCLRTSKI